MTPRNFMATFFQWPWVKGQIVPPVNMPIPTKTGSKLGGEFTESPKMGSQNGFDNHSQMCRHLCTVLAIIAHLSLRLEAKFAKVRKARNSPLQLSRNQVLPISFAREKVCLFLRVPVWGTITIPKQYPKKESETPPNPPKSGPIHPTKLPRRFTVHGSSPKAPEETRLGSSFPP